MKTAIYIYSAAMALAFAALAQNPAGSPKKGSWNVREHVPLEKFTIQSHRGAGILAPENTLEAFELGWKMGTVPESDLRTTKDGVIVAFHDNDFSRVVKGVSEELKKKGVKDLTFAELSKLDVGAWHEDSFAPRRVSKMTEVFALMKGRPDRRLYLDIKNVDLKQLAQEVKDYEVQKQVILASTKYEIIRHWKALLPESNTLLWMGGEEDALKQRFVDLKKTDFADVTQLQIHIHLKERVGAKAVAEHGKPAPPTGPLSEEPFTLSKGFLIDCGKQLHKRGIVFQTLPYDTDDEHVYHTLMDLGVESFSTDYPDAALRAVKNYYSKKK